MRPPGSVLKTPTPLHRVGHLLRQSRPVLAAIADSKCCGGPVKQESLAWRPCSCGRDTRRHGALTLPKF